MVFSVVIVGRPNVGKSTLFNRLTRRRAAIVDDTPGVTRDRREGDGQLGSLRFRIIDTAGLEDSGGPQSLAARMTEQTMRAVNEADLALLLVDGRAGINPTDKHFCKIMHEKGKKTVLIVSKCEGRAGDSTSADAWGLGFGQPIKISAEHAEGLGDLFDSLLLHIEAHDQQKLSRNELPSSNERQSAE